MLVLVLVTVSTSEQQHIWFGSFLPSSRALQAFKTHKKNIIDAAKEKKKNGGKGKGKDKKGGKGKGKVKQICRDFNTPGKGCLRSSSCRMFK